MFIYMLTGLSVVALLLFIAGAVRSEWERRQLKVEYYSVKGKGSGSRLRLAFISDVHDYYRFDGADRIFEAVCSVNPDVVLIGGDLFTYVKEKKTPPDTSEALKLTAALSERFPVIYAPGNHETRFEKIYPELFKEYADALKKQGVVYINDDAAVISSGTEFCFYGAELDFEYYERLIPFIGSKADMPEKYLIGKLGIPDRKRFNILLMHSPLYEAEANSWGADLVLSGHFHGGTIRLPLLGGVLTPQYQFFCRECAGQHKVGCTDMIVSRGIGTHSFNIRFNNMPEISVIDIKTESTNGRTDLQA